MLFNLSKMSKSVGSAILSMKKLPTAGPYPTGDPYLFCVYHKDEYPPGNDEMEAPWPGNGHDFNPDNPYRMYHGSKIPGRYFAFGTSTYQRDPRFGSVRCG